MFGSTGFSVSPFSQSGGGVSPNVSVAVEGVWAKGSVPIAIEEHGGAFAENSFAEAPFSSEKSDPAFITVNSTANVAVTGVEATSAVGSEIGVIPATASVTGIAGTGAVGTAVGSIPVSVSVTGLQATMPVVSVDSGGSLFGGIAFCEEPFAELEDTGLKVVISTGTGVSVTGVEGTGTVGSVAIDAAANVPVTGSSATGEVDSVSVIGEANVSPTGVAATGAPGTVTIVEGTGVNVAITSPRLQGQVGVVAPNAQIKVFLTGVAGTGQTSGASVVSWNEIIVNQDPNWVEIAA